MEPQFVITSYNISGGSRFPRWGRGPIRGHGPQTQALFSENVCENERIVSHGGGGCPP